MIYLLRLLALVVLCTQLFIVQSQAQNQSGKQVAQKRSDIEELKRRIDEIQRQNQKQIEELQKKIEQIEAERASEKEAAEKVIAKEKEDKDAWYNKFEAGYKKGLFFKTNDGNFLMKMRLRTQFQFSVNDTDDEDTATDFRIRRFRVKWNGHAFRPWFLYTIQLDADSGEVRLRDAYFGVAYNTGIVPRVGQFKVPFNRERLTSSSSLQLVERSIVSGEFSIGRDIGSGLYGILGNMITYGGGIFNGDGRNARSTNSNLLYAGRIQFNPCCGKLKYNGEEFPSGGSYELVSNFGGREPIVAIGGAFYTFPGLNIARKTPDDRGIGERFVELGIESGNVTGVTADISFKNYLFNLVAEYDGRWIDPKMTESGSLDTLYDQGFRVQGGIFILPKTLELAARFAYVDYDTGSGITGDVRDSKWQITPGINYYISKDHRWKIQLDYNFIKNTFTESEDIDENIFRAQLQAYF
ncbi:MAG: porin [Thermodesulfobacteriota bacterium]